jgi:hypothetical protein
VSRDLSYLSKYQGRVDPNNYQMPGGINFPRISVGDNRFTAITAEGEETFLSIKEFEFVVLDSNPNYSKVYYAKGYDANNPSPPDCYSENGFSPDTRVFEPQSYFCHECKQNQWGSALSKLSGAQIKACADYKKLAIFLVHDEVEGVFQFRIPSASLQNWRRYVTELNSFPTGGNFKLLPHQVLTRARWSDKQNVLAFERVDFLDEDWLEVIISHQNANEYESWIGLDNQSQAKRQLESMKLKPAPQIEHGDRKLQQQAKELLDKDPYSNGKVIDVEPERAPPAPKKKIGAAKASPKQEEAPTASESPLTRGQSIMDRARARAQEKIAAEAKR